MSLKQHLVKRMTVVLLLLYCCCSVLMLLLVTLVSLTVQVCMALGNQFKHYNLIEDGLSFMLILTSTEKNTLDCVNEYWVYTDT